MSTATAHRDAFVALVHDLCDVLRQPRVALNEGVEERCALVVDLDGVEIAVVHGDTPEPARFSVYARFGQPEADREADNYRKLLELNTQLSAMIGATFGVEESSGDIVFGYHARIADFDGRALLHRLDDAADLADRWRDDRFIPRDATTPPVLFSGSKA